MKLSRAAALLCLLLVSAIALVQEPPATEVADQPTQDQYSMQVYSLVNVASEIQAGRGDKLATNIQGDLPGHLQRMADFRPTPLKKAVFLAARSLFRATGTAIPSELQPSFDQALAGGGQALSAGCFKLLPICSTNKCIPLPISLRPVDVNAPDPMGWHYLIGSHCGVKGWKGWKFWQGCGEPVGVTACTGDQSDTESATHGAATGGMASHAHHPAPAGADVPDQVTQDQYGMQVLDLIHTAGEIRAGRQRQLKEDIASGLPGHLRNMVNFHDSPVKRMTFRMTNELFKAMQKEIPADLQPPMSSLIAEGVNGMQSEGCFKVLPVCNPKGCLPLPFSPRPVDVNTPDPMGFHYLLYSHCGVKGWKGWKFWEACGEPVTATACTGSMEGGETGVMPNVPEAQALPEGVIYATAVVTQDSTIDVQQPGYALVATAGVTEVKRVNPGEHLNVRKVASIAFDDGTGLLIHLLTRRADDHFNATAGKDSLTSEDHPLPVSNGTATVYVGSDKPFHDCAVAANDQNKTPAVTQAVIRDARGEKVGQLSTFKGLPQEASNVAVRTLDSSGQVVEQAPVPGGVLNGTPSVQFDKPTYKQGDKGVLLIGNQENYRKMVEMTRFGGAQGLEQEPIRLLQVEDVKGLPPETPFSTTRLSFTATHAGQARVALVFPRMVPPRLVPDPGNDPELQRANSTFDKWRSFFVK